MGEAISGGNCWACGKVSRSGFLCDECAGRVFAEERAVVVPDWNAILKNMDGIMAKMNTNEQRMALIAGELSRLGALIENIQGFLAPLAFQHGMILQAVQKEEKKNE